MDWCDFHFVAEGGAAQLSSQSQAIVVASGFDRYGQFVAIDVNSGLSITRPPRAARAILC